jgi:hypothetical protein
MGMQRRQELLLGQKMCIRASARSIRRVPTPYQAVGYPNLFLTRFPDTRTVVAITPRAADGPLLGIDERWSTLPIFCNSGESPLLDFPWHRIVLQIVT